MLPPRPNPEPQRRSRGGPLFVIWLIALGAIVFNQTAGRYLREVGVPGALFSLTTFFAALVCIALTLYGLAVAVRWTLRKLFWRVGRRLFLSYVLIGVLPFFLFAILLLALVYMISGVMCYVLFLGDRTGR